MGDLGNISSEDRFQRFVVSPQAKLDSSKYGVLVTWLLFMLTKTT